MFTFNHCIRADEMQLSNEPDIGAFFARGLPGAIW